jgi:hypothetical protein
MKPVIAFPDHVISAFAKTGTQAIDRTFSNIETIKGLGYSILKLPAFS